MTYLISVTFTLLIIILLLSVLKYKPYKHQIVVYDENILVNLFSLIIENIKVVKILYTVNKTVDGYHCLDLVSDKILYLNDLKHLDFNKKNKLTAELNDLVIHLQSLGMYRVKEKLIINQLIKELN